MVLTSETLIVTVDLSVTLTNHTIKIGMAPELLLYFTLTGGMHGTSDH